MVMALLKRKWLYGSDNDTEIRDKNGDIMVSIMKGGGHYKGLGWGNAF